jgi:hypothetical protein
MMPHIMALRFILAHGPETNRALSVTKRAPVLQTAAHEANYTADSGRSSTSLTFASNALR